MNIVLDDALLGWEETFAQHGEVIALAGRKINATHVKNADALIIRSRTQINDALLADSTTSFIGSAVAGQDHIEPRYLNHPNITLYSAQGCNSNAVAEYVITALVTLSEQKNFSLEGKTIAVIGVGHIGKKVTRYAQALGMKIWFNDPPRRNNEPDFEHTPLETCMQADIITVHAPFTRTGDHPTINLLNAHLIEKLSPNAIVINAARGGIIDETALIKQPLTARVIDCWHNESQINLDLLDRADIATPHIAGHSVDAKLNGTLMCYEAFCQHFNLTPQAPELNLKPEQPVIRESLSLANTLNRACPIIRDTKKLKKDPEKLEQLRIDYPARFEFKHYLSTAPNPLLEKLSFNGLID